ncbi:hypothetical protein DFQ14_102572 [Halopolyspora algeriensis]|uniref:Uncharacterized protein n=1 Tax=Halopolyspora algeriensis TaxID=1500506 RepID=A0A368VWP0_9ACTN|nr:hypothetical protein [Halopolyspora algeriensis]RCW46269.1 hypothetical protein DFQ14_102572 [Halopolyspora algeriensis]TQM55671.1 hypothetical protein FHU43_0446 [Halopolyspora algeriensis]
MNTAHIEFSHRNPAPEPPMPAQLRFGWFTTPDPAEPAPHHPQPHELSWRCIRFADPRDPAVLAKLLRALRNS